MTPTFTAYLTGPLVAVFHAHRPGITLDVREMAQDRIEAELAGDQVDLGIGFSRAHLPDIAATALFTGALGLVVGAAHPHADRRDPLPVHELRDHQLALLSSDFATRLGIDEYFAEHGGQPRTGVEANSVGAPVEIVRRTGLIEGHVGARPHTRRRAGHADGRPGEAGRGAGAACGLPVGRRENLGRAGDVGEIDVGEDRPAPACPQTRRPAPLPRTLRWG